MLDSPTGGKRKSLNHLSSEHRAPSSDGNTPPKSRNDQFSDHSFSLNNTSPLFSETYTRITVLERREVPALGSSQRFEIQPTAPVLEALTEHYSTDAHCATYAARDGGPTPRLSLRAPNVTWARVAWGVVFYDVDASATDKAQGHVAVAAWKQGFKLLQLADLGDEWGWYETRGGFRVVALLPHQLGREEYLKAWARGAAALAEAGLEVDRQTRDADTRLYRLPYVQRDGEDQRLDSHLLDDLPTLNLEALPPLAPDEAEKIRERVRPRQAPLATLENPADLQDVDSYARSAGAPMKAGESRHDALGRWINDLYNRVGVEAGGALEGAALRIAMELQRPLKPRHDLIREIRGWARWYESKPRQTPRRRPQGRSQPALVCISPWSEGARDVRTERATVTTDTERAMYETATGTPGTYRVCVIPTGAGKSTAATRYAPELVRRLDEEGRSLDLLITAQKHTDKCALAARVEDAATPLGVPTRTIRHWRERDTQGRPFCRRLEELEEEIRRREDPTHPTAAALFGLGGSPCSTKASNGQLIECPYAAACPVEREKLKRKRETLERGVTVSTDAARDSLALPREVLILADEIPAPWATKTASDADVAAASRRWGLGDPLHEVLNTLESAAREVWRDLPSDRQTREALEYGVALQLPLADEVCDTEALKAIRANPQAWRPKPPTWTSLLSEHSSDALIGAPAVDLALAWAQATPPDDDDPPRSVLTAVISGDPSAPRLTWTLDTRRTLPPSTRVLVLDATGGVDMARHRAAARDLGLKWLEPLVIETSGAMQRGEIIVGTSFDRSHTTTRERLVTKRGVEATARAARELKAELRTQGKDPSAIRLGLIADMPVAEVCRAGRGLSASPRLVNQGDETVDQNARDALSAALSGWRGIEIGHVGRDHIATNKFEEAAVMLHLGDSRPNLTDAARRALVYTAFDHDDPELSEGALLQAAVRAQWLQRLGRARGAAREDEEVLQVIYGSENLSKWLMTLPGYRWTSRREAIGPAPKIDERAATEAQAEALASRYLALASAWLEDVDVGRNIRREIVTGVARRRGWPLKPWRVRGRWVYAASADVAGEALSAREAGSISNAPLTGINIEDQKHALPVSGALEMLGGARPPEPWTEPLDVRSVTTPAEAPLALVPLARARADKSNEGAYEEFEALEPQIGVEGLLGEVIEGEEQEATEEAVSLSLSEDQEAVLSELRALYQAANEITLRGFDERYTKRAISGTLDQVFRKAEARGWTVRVERVEAGFSVFVLNQPMPENWLVDAMRQDREWAERRLAESNRSAQQVKAPRGRPFPFYATER